jgi:hypothetical protein
MPKPKKVGFVGLGAMGKRDFRSRQSTLDRKSKIAGLQQAEIGVSRRRKLRSMRRYLLQWSSMPNKSIRFYLAIRAH